MDANELRFGNFLNYDNGKEVFFGTMVQAADILWCQNDNKSFNDLYVPIPLTEEWFLKLGFRKGEYNAGNSKGFQIKTNKGDLILLYWKVLSHPRCHSFQVFIGSTNISELEYVHQLQNLYFALTGEELTTKNNG